MTWAAAFAALPNCMRAAAPFLPKRHESRRAISNKSIENHAAAEAYYFLNSGNQQAIL